MKPKYSSDIIHSTMRRMLNEDPEWKAHVFDIINEDHLPKQR